MAFFEDDLQGSATLLENWTPDVGDSWTALDKSGPRSMQVIETGVRFDGNGGNQGVVYTADATYPSADYAVQMTLVDIFSDECPVYMFARVQDVDNFYAVRLRDTAGSCQLYKKVGGTWTALGSAFDPPANGSVVKLEVSGSSITFYDDDVEVAAATDSEITAAGKAGIGGGGGPELVEATDDVRAVVMLHTFSVTEVAGGGTEHDPLVADAGSYSIAGQTAGLLAGRWLPPAAGVYQVTGHDLAITKTRLMVLGAGTYATAGHDLVALASRYLVGGPGTHAVDGQPLTIIVGQEIVLQPGSHDVLGSPLALIINRLLVGLSDGYEVTPRPVTITRSHVLRPSMGVYTLEGQETGLRASRLAILVKIVYNVSGQPVDLRVSNVFRIFLDRGAYGVNGGAPDLLVDRHLPVGAGATAITGSPVDLLRHYVLLPTSGEILVSPSLIGLPTRRLLTVDQGAYPIDGVELGLNRVRTLLLSAGSHGYSGSALDVIRAYYLALGGADVVITGIDLAMTYAGEIVPIIRVTISGTNRMTSVDGPTGSTTKGVRVRTHPK